MKGHKPRDDHGQLNSDEYRAIMGDEKAEVEMLVGTSLGYGEVKVHAVIKLTCNQDRATLLKGGELAFRMARELCESGFSELVPPEPAPPVPSPPSPTYGAPR